MLWQAQRLELCQGEDELETRGSQEIDKGSYHMEVEVGTEWYESHQKPPSRRDESCHEAGTAQPDACAFLFNEDYHLEQEGDPQGDREEHT